MAKKAKTGGAWRLASVRDPRARALIKRLQAQQDDATAERRRRLTNGVSRALLHLRDDEMGEIERVVYGAIGRSIVQR